MPTLHEVPALAPWNTQRLSARLGIDVVSAATAGALTCPAITVIDRAIIEKAAKGIPIKQTIVSCARSAVSHPGGFFLTTPFLLIYTLYTATYVTANVIDTMTATLYNQPFATVFAGPAKFLTTTAVNMGICVYKDARFARIFGPSSSSTSTQIQGKHAAVSCHPCAKVPPASFALFCLRDSITIFASFNVPPLVAPYIPDAVAATARSKAALAQFACPALMQLISTPMHLLGLDLYNRPSTAEGKPVTWPDRVARIRRDYVPSCFARMGKIVPAYGVGGVVNVRMREGLMQKIQ